jgi:RNA polymerase sigma-70 factor (sigma-E family)
MGPEWPGLSISAMRDSPLRGVADRAASVLGTVRRVSVGGDHLARQACASGVTPRVVTSARAKREDVGRRPTQQVPEQPGAGPARAGPDGNGPDQLSRAADPDFRDYVKTRGRALLRTAYLLTGNLADAEDLVQAALAKTYQAWDRIEDRGALDGYVRRAMVNTHISWWRRRRLQEFPTDELPDRPVDDHAGDRDLQDTLRRAIDRLPQRMRAAVVLRYYEDMTEAEVAERLGVSLGTVKSTVSRAVAKLRIDAELLAD